VKVWLDIERRSGIDRRECHKPYTEQGNLWLDAPYVIAEGRCPGCDCAPFKVRGTGDHGVVKYDADAVEVEFPGQTHKTGGRCEACGDPVGWMYAHIMTLFGIDEDRAVLHGRCRVYAS
jgi:hypothetical protein